MSFITYRQIKIIMSTISSLDESFVMIDDNPFRFDYDCKSKILTESDITREIYNKKLEEDLENILAKEANKPSSIYDIIASYFY